jgi:hypothetical protein
VFHPPDSGVECARGVLYPPDGVFYPPDGVFHPPDGVFHPPDFRAVLQVYQPHQTDKPDRSRPPGRDRSPEQERKSGATPIAFHAIGDPSRPHGDALPRCARQAIG